MPETEMALKPSPLWTGAKSVPGLLQYALQMRAKGTLQFVMDLWRAEGDLAQLRLGPVNLFLAFHPDHVRQISVTARSSFDKDKTYEMSRVLLLGDGLIGSNGELWKRQRRLMAGFFSPRSVEQYYPVMLAAAEANARRWAPIAGSGKPVQMIDEMMLVTAWIIVQAMFGIDVADERLSVLKGDVESLITFVTQRGHSVLKLPLSLPLPSHRRYHAARARVHGLVNELVASRRAQPQAQWPDDLLSKLMLARDEETGESMPDMLVRDESLGIFIAGHETTARTMAFLWYALHENPGVERRLHAELDAVLPHGEAPALEHLKRLPYTLQVIKEVLRLYPAAPFFPRDVLTDQVIDGVRIPAGSIVMLSPYATHRHPDFWDEPERFDPDRWRPEREAARHPYAYHPFAAGHRICLGNNFAMLEAHILAALLVRRFRARLVPGHRPQFRSHGTLVVPNGLPMTITAR